MARSFASGSSQYIQNNNAVVTQREVTLAAWVYLTAASNSYTVLSIGDRDGGVRNILYLECEPEASDRNVGIHQFRAGVFGGLQTTTAYSLNIWNHVAILVSGSTGAAYLNGGGKNTGDLGAADLPGLNTTSIGSFIDADGTHLNYFNGRIGEAGIWDVALTDAEIDILALGYSPLLVRPQSLISYWPLIGRTSPEIDLAGGYDMTLNAAPTTAAHPPVIYPSPPMIGLSTPRSGLQIDIRPQRNYIQVV